MAIVGEHRSGSLVGSSHQLPHFLVDGSSCVFGKVALCGNVATEDVVWTREAQATETWLRLERLNEKKLKAFADKDQQTYVKVFREGQVEFQKSVVSITKKACEWIELEASNYLQKWVD